MLKVFVIFDTMSLMFIVYRMAKKDELIFFQFISFTFLCYMAYSRINGLMQNIF